MRSGTSSAMDMGAAALRARKRWKSKTARGDRRSTPMFFADAAASAGHIQTINRTGSGTEHEILHALPGACLQVWSPTRIDLGTGGRRYVDGSRIPAT